MKFITLLIFISLSVTSTLACHTQAQTLEETKSYLYKLKNLRNNGKKINKKSALEVAARVEKVAKSPCYSSSEHKENEIQSMGYTMAAAIWGLLSKDTNDIGLGKKSYYALEKARALDPNNLDALKGQAIALSQIVVKNYFIRTAVSVALGINLKEAARELSQNLRDYPERKDLQDLAKKLEKFL